MINVHKFFDTKMTPMRFFVISFKLQGQFCKIIPLSFVCVASSLTRFIVLLLLLSLSPTPMMKTQYHRRRRRHGGCRWILEKDEIWLLRSEWNKHGGGGYGGGGGETAWWWGDLAMAASSSMGSEIDTVGRRRPSDGEWDVGGRWTRDERDLQRRER